MYMCNVELNPVSCSYNKHQLIKEASLKPFEALLPSSNSINITFFPQTWTRNEFLISELINYLDVFFSLAVLANTRQPTSNQNCDLSITWMYGVWTQWKAGMNFRSVSILKRLHLKYKYEYNRTYVFLIKNNDRPLNWSECSMFNWGQIVTDSLHD